jgi:hypothetical protein
MAVKAITVPDAAGYPSVALFTMAGELKAALATSKLALYKAGNIVIGEETDLATMTGNEADFDGYTAGGIAITAAGDPYVDQDGGGYLVTLPSVQFNFTKGTPNVSNQIGGAYVLDSAGKLRGVFPFPAPVRMATNEDSVVVAASFRVTNPA